MGAFLGQGKGPLRCLGLGLGALLGSWCGMAHAQVVPMFPGVYGSVDSTSCVAGGICGISPGNKSINNANEFYVFRNFNTKTGGYAGVQFRNTAPNVIAGVTASEGTIIHVPVTFAQPDTSFVLLSPGGIRISGGGGFSIVDSRGISTPLQNLVLSTAAKFNEFDIINPAVEPKTFGSQIKYAKDQMGGMVTPDGQISGLSAFESYRASNQSSIEIELSNVKLLVERSLLISAQEANISIVGGIKLSERTEIRTTANGTRSEIPYGKNGIFINGDNLKIDRSNLVSNGEILVSHRPQPGGLSPKLPQNAINWVITNSTFAIGDGPVFKKDGVPTWEVTLETNGFGQSESYGPIDITAKDIDGSEIVIEKINNATSLKSGLFVQGVKVDAKTSGIAKDEKFVFSASIRGTTDAGQDLKMAIGGYADVSSGYDLLQRQTIDGNNLESRLVVSSFPSIASKTFLKKDQFGKDDYIGKDDSKFNGKLLLTGVDDIQQLGLTFLSSDDQLISREWSIAGRDLLGNLKEPTSSVADSGRFNAFSPALLQSFSIVGLWNGGDDKDQAVLRYLQPPAPVVPPANPQTPPGTSVGSGARPLPAAQVGVANAQPPILTIFDRFGISIDANIVQDFDNSALSLPGSSRPALASPESQQAASKTIRVDPSMCAQESGTACGAVAPASRRQGP